MKFELDNVEVSFNGNRILYGIYLKAEKNKITGILGSNGCGKTSLLKIFFGNLNCNNKLVKINDKGTLKPLYTQVNVKFLPQTDFLPNAMKIKKLFQLHKLDWERFFELFPTFKNYQKNSVKHLSGGEKRLLATWLILKSDADLILLDEPLTHLSPIYTTIIKQEILKEKNNKAILLTDHLYLHLFDICDRLYFLKNGCSKMVETKEELIEEGYLSS